MFKRTLLPPCISCGEPVPTLGWEADRGFLVPCPSCVHWHGRHWHPRLVLFGSFFLNALSYFLTLRPERALAALSSTFVILWLPAIAFPATEIPDWLGLSWIVCMLFGPLAVNAVLLIRHESLLGKRVNPFQAPPPPSHVPSAPIRPS